MRTGTAGRGGHSALARLRTGPLWFLALALGAALALLEAAYQAVATERDRHAYPPPGQLVDVGGYRLAIHCVGEGTPTVVLETGLGAPSEY